MFVRHVMEQQSFMKMTKLGEIQCKIELYYENPQKRAPQTIVFVFFKPIVKITPSNRRFHHLFIIALYRENPYQSIIQLLPPLSAL